MAGSETESPNPDQQEIPDNLVELARIDARIRQTRIISISICVAIGLVCITVGVVKVLAKPPWVQITLVIIAKLFGPSGIIWYILRSRRKFVKKHHRRIVLLEQRLDPDRSSSSESDPTENPGAEP